MGSIGQVEATGGAGSWKLEGCTRYKCEQRLMWGRSSIIAEEFDEDELETCASFLVFEHHCCTARTTTIPTYAPPSLTESSDVGDLFQCASNPTRLRSQLEGEVCGHVRLTFYDYGYDRLFRVIAKVLS